jgi:hypothetical protein
MIDQKLTVAFSRLKEEHLIDWTDKNMVARSYGYLDKLERLAFISGLGVVAVAHGTEDYYTRVFLNKDGSLESECSCPVGRRCKHATAIIINCSRKIKEGESIEECPIDGDYAKAASLAFEKARDLMAKRVKMRESYKKTDEAPARKIIRIKVEENPFDRYKANGGRGDRSFSFRVATETDVYHWNFIVATLIYSLAKKSLDYVFAVAPWWDGADEGDPAMFTCSCGSAECGGFGRQKCTFAEGAVLWSVEYGDRTVEFEFDRPHYEYWALLMLYRMRGSEKLRRDPWDDLVEKDCFNLALSALLDTNVRLLALWMLIKERRRLSPEDLSMFDKANPDGGARLEKGAYIRNFFPRTYSTERKIDLCQERPTEREKSIAGERMNTVKLENHGLYVYADVIGRHWEPTEILYGHKPVFVREPNNDFDPRSIRVDDAATGNTIGYMRRAQAHWLSDMIDKYGLELVGRVEPIGRDGKIIPLRIDIVFKKESDASMDWGASLPVHQRLYFDMLRSVVFNRHEYSAAMIKAEMNRISKLFENAGGVPEVQFLIAILVSGAKELEYRLTSAEIAKRREYCRKVRRALVCEMCGGMLDYDGLKVLPVKALNSDTRLSAIDAKEKLYRWIRLTWSPPINEMRPKIAIDGFPNDATGFAVFRDDSLIDFCLCGIPVAGLELFDSIAFYKKPCREGPSLTEDKAFLEVEKFLAALPVRELEEDGRPPHFWLERGIHDGMYEIDESGRLIAMRFLMMGARETWVD